eukprot:GHVN01020661.1.p4 GENE.GHVN01020661.1~~GHVN01020661.1.p4  ORF type:complete len:126 (+),score=18.30 GHVN01020661.1:3545-3922(+)
MGPTMIECYTHTSSLKGQNVAFWILKLVDSVLIWVGEPSAGKAVMNDLHVGIPSGSRNDNGVKGPALSACIVGDTDSPASEISQKLAMRFQFPVYLSINYGGLDDEGFFLLQKELVEKIPFQKSG